MDGTPFPRGRSEEQEATAGIAVESLEEGCLRLPALAAAVVDRKHRGRYSQAAPSHPLQAARGSACPRPTGTGARDPTPPRQEGSKANRLPAHAGRRPDSVRTALGV